MDPVYGSGINAGPYLFLAYGAGTAILLGYLAWSLWDRVKVRKLESIVKEANKR